MSDKPTLLVLEGLPASGKSTKAAGLVAEGWTRVNRDDLRAMMHAGRYTPATEELVRDVEEFVVTQALKRGRDVVVDDTNLNPDTAKLWLSCAILAGGASIEFLPMDTPLEECVRRDAARDHPVGEAVIRTMAAKAGLGPHWHHDPAIARGKPYQHVHEHTDSHAHLAAE